MGRPSKYDTNVKGRLFEIECWARDGYIDEDIADKLGIALSTYYEYKKKYVEFSDAIKKGKEIIDYEVENALLKKAMGFTKTVPKAIKLKEVEYDEETGKKISEKERIVYVDEEFYYPPDTTAEIFWLKNRKPKKWRDKQEVKHSGEIIASRKSDDEIESRIKELESK